MQIIDSLLFTPLSSPQKYLVFKLKIERNIDIQDTRLMRRNLAKIGINRTVISCILALFSMAETLFSSFECNNIIRQDPFNIIK